MTNDRKAAANRRNARKSTGPKTPEGKAAVRQNALKHGLLSQEVLLPDEDEEALQELDDRLRTELQPAGELESLLVDRIIAAYWRLRRLGRVEAGIFDWELYEELAERAEQEVRAQESTWVDRLEASDTEVIDERKHREAVKRAKKIRTQQGAAAATLGRAFARDVDKANAFSKLSRYEAAIERQLYRALHELERRQAARRGRSVPAPMAVDVDVSGITEGDR